MRLEDLKAQIDEAFDNLSPEDVVRGFKLLGCEFEKKQVCKRGTYQHEVKNNIGCVDEIVEEKDIFSSIEVCTEYTSISILSVPNNGYNIFSTKNSGREPQAA